MIDLVRPLALTLALAGALALAGCARDTAAPVAAGAVSIDEVPEWRGTAAPEDAARIDRIDGIWERALAAARGGARRAVEAEGALLDPAAALARPEPAPGPYRCRVLRLGGSGRDAAFRAYRPFFCYVDVEGEYLTIVKQTGSERPAGYLFPDAGRKRLVFLGTLAVGSDEEPLAYAEDRDRDLAGVVERVAPFRYRLVIPEPPVGAMLDVIELVPAPQ